MTKEIFIAANHTELTAPLGNSYTRGGEIYMAENSPDIKAQTNVSASETGSVVQPAEVTEIPEGPREPFLTGETASQEYTKKFHEEIEPRIPQMTLDEIKAEYFGLNDLTHAMREQYIQEHHGIVGLEKDSIGSSLGPYGGVLIDAYRDKGGDATALFLEYQKTRPSGRDTRISAGAAVMPDGFSEAFTEGKYDSSSVQGIADSIRTTAGTDAFTTKFIDQRVNLLTELLSDAHKSGDAKLIKECEELNRNLLNLFEKVKLKEASEAHEESAFQRAAQEASPILDEALTSRAEILGFGEVMGRVREIFAGVDSLPIGDLQAKLGDMYRQIASLDPRAYVEGEDRGKYAKMVNDFESMKYILRAEVNKVVRPRLEAMRGREDPYQEEIAKLQKAHERLRERGLSEDERFAIYSEIDHLIESVDFSGLASRSNIIQHLAEMSLKESRGHEHYGYAIEYAVERVIGKGDNMPTVDYPQFNFQEQQNLDELIQTTRVLGDNKLYEYLINLSGKRRFTHQLFKQLKDPEEFISMVTKGLDTGGFNFIENNVVGTSLTQVQFEKELGWQSALNGYNKEGWLRFEQYRQVDKAVQRRVIEQLSAQERSVIVPSEDGHGEVKHVRRVRPWEAARAFSMGRAMHAADQRRLTWTAIGDRPPHVEDFVKSLEAEHITTRLAPIKLVAYRYFRGMSGGKRFLRHLREEKKLQAENKGMTYGLKVKTAQGIEEIQAPYGYTEEANILLDMGPVDAKSSGWRAKSLFLHQEAFQSNKVDRNEFHHTFPSDEPMTALDYLNAIQDEVTAKYSDELMPDGVTKNPHFIKDHHERHHEVEHEFNHRIEPFIHEQRLFLGVLQSTYSSNISHETKKVLWEKASDLIPSRIASILPHDTMRIVKEVYGTNITDKAALEAWDTLRDKLYAAEQRRVDEDARGLTVLRESGQIVLDAAGMPRLVDDSVVQKTLEDYLSEQEMTEEQKIVVRKLQALGKGRAEELASVFFPFTTFLDDVPKTAWGNLGRNELDRILVNDQNDYRDGYGGLVGLIGNPAQGFDEVAKAMHTAVVKIKSPTSLEDAQAYVRPFVISWFKMGMQKKSSLLTFGVGRVFRRPRSEMEEINMQSGIAFEPAEVAKYAYELAHHEVIADDLDEVDAKGRTGLIQMFDYLHLRKRDLAGWKSYGLTMIIAHYLIMELLKATVPEDVGKL